MSSMDFFDLIIKDSISLINEEMEKLRLKKVMRDDVLLFFDDDSFGINVSVSIRKSRKLLLNKRMIKISRKIAVEHRVSGYSIVVE